MRIPPPNPLTVVTVWIAAIFIAVREGAEKTHVLPVLVSAMSGWLSFFPLAVLVLAAIVYLARLFGVAGAGKAKKPLEKITNRTFQNEVVSVDGKYFSNCRFENATLRYAGGDFFLKGCTATGYRGFEASHDGCGGAVDILKFLKLLDEEFAKNWGKLPAEHFIE